MNQILINHNECKYKLDDSIEIIEQQEDVLKVTIRFKKNTTLILKENGITKLDVKIRLDPNVVATIKCSESSKQRKVQYHYFLEQNSSLTVEKFACNDESKSLEIVDLNGDGASFYSVLKSLVLAKQRMDMVIYHNACNTKSNIENKGVTKKDGSCYWNVTGIIYAGIKNCVMNQKNHIITLNHHTSRIDPNLLIEENDVTANHSAYIGTFEESIFFYFETRGIPRKKALSLLVEGFLTGETMEEADKETIKCILGGEE